MISHDEYYAQTGDRIFKPNQIEFEQSPSSAKL
jgi:hypothetical protein